MSVASCRNTFSRAGACVEEGECRRSTRRARRRPHTKHVVAQAPHDRADTSRACCQAVSADQGIVRGMSTRIVTGEPATSRATESAWAARDQGWERPESVRRSLRSLPARAQARAGESDECESAHLLGSRTRATLFGKPIHAVHVPFCISSRSILFQ